ncbi:MAG: amino acid adenylation domain-containing protein [Nannocystis sp.]|nr:amino acid adenylation domain-containing protein [Nannocystis sp.]
MATRTSHALAVMSARGNLDYGELLRRATTVAQALQRQGVGRGTLVGLFLPRSLEAVVAILGTLLAGGAYLPIDPDYPRARQRFLIEDSQVKVIVTAPSLAIPPPELADHPIVDLDALAGELPSPGFQPVELSPDDLLYVLYSSGSTGRPKGICGTHGATLNRLRWGYQAFPFAPERPEVVAHRSSLNFVDSVVELFSGLLCGVPTALLSYDETRSPSRMLSALHQAQVTRLTVVPSVLDALLRTAPELGAALPRLTLWACSGEELTLPLLRQFRLAHKLATLVNIYGSTEVTADVTYAVFTPDTELPSERVPIGIAMAGAELSVLDDQLQPVADGESGELFVGGPVLSRGYLRRPEEQALRFLAHPRRPGEQIFRTGDRVRRGEDGQLYFLGRTDNQIKILGIRIEPEEIERTLLAACPGLSQLAVVVRETPGQPQSRRLCAFFAPAQYDPELLQTAARQRLPSATIPKEFLPTSGLPLLPGGKLDRRTLATWANHSPRNVQPAQEPRSDTERRLAALFATLLGQAPISRQDSFMALGGGSLALAELLDALDRCFRATFLDSVLVYRQPLFQLARWIDEGTAPAPESEPPAEQILSLSTVDSAAAIRFAAEVDAQREPLTLVTDLSLEDQIPYVSPIVACSLADGVSFVARDCGSGKLVGFCLAHDFCSPAGVALAEISSRLRPIVQILTEIESEYVTLCGQPALGEVVQLSLTGVSPEIDGYELARRLEQRTLDAARLRGYRRALTICTSRITSVLAERTGFQRLSAFDYATYEIDGQRVFQPLAARHREIVLYVKDLS